MRNIGLPEIIALCGVLFMFGVALTLLMAALRGKQNRSVHRALIDKVGSGNELREFVQTSAGQQFIRSISESESPARSIISSMQRGIVILVVGLGLVALGLLGGVPLPLASIGAVLAFLGAGLLAAAYCSYRVARRWNLLEKNSDHLS